MEDDDGMKKYHKIFPPFNRHTEGPNRKKLDVGKWFSPELEMLRDVPWNWTEKINGTNIRYHWDGHKPELGGRTDDASIPAKLVRFMTDLLPEELFEQAFGQTAVTLYGEGFGGNAANSRAYGTDYRFALFDVRIGQWWLRRHDVTEISMKLGIERAPELRGMTLNEAVALVQRGVRSQLTTDPNAFAEGIIGTPACGLLDRSGHRIIVKVKHADLYDPTLSG